MVDHALETVGHCSAWMVTFALELVTNIVTAMRRLMDQLNIAAQLQIIILVLPIAGLIVLALRVFCGLVRIMLTLFLLLLLAHIAVHHGGV